MLKVIFDFIVAAVKIWVSFLYSAYRIFAPRPSASVRNDVVLVTGAANGIGKELVQQYGELGAQIICVDINEDGNKKIADQLKRQNFLTYAYTCDVTDRSAVMALAEKVRRDVGFVTILVNNAGIAYCKRFLRHTPEETQRLFNVNVLSQIWMVQAFLPAMISNNYGHIVALSSTAGLIGKSYIAPYCSTKFAVRGFMEGLQAELHELKYNIKLTTVFPFAVDTGMRSYVKIGRPALLKMQEAAHVASAIVSAQRRGLREVSCPFYLHFACLLRNLLPDKTNDAVMDYLNSGVYPEL